MPVCSTVSGSPTASRRSGTGRGGTSPAPSRRSHPGRRRRCRGRRAPGPCWRPASRAARWRGRSPTACCRPAPSWCTCSRRRRPARPPRCPCPPSVFIALPAVTQLLTSGAGVERVQQNDRVRAAGLKGDRDVAAHRRRRHHQRLDAVGLGDRRRSRSTARRPAPRSRAARINPTHHTPPHVPPPSSLASRRPAPSRKVVNHITANGPRRKRLTAATPRGSPPSTQLFRALAACSRRALAPVAAAAGAGDGCGVAPSTRWMSGFICCSCAPQYSQLCVPLDGKLNTPFLPPAAM